MLIAGLITLLVVMNGSHSTELQKSFEQTEKSIKASVSDPTRRDAAIEILRLMAMQESNYLRSRDQTVQTLTDLLAVRQTPIASIESATQPVLEGDRASASKLLDMREQLKNVLTAEEWSKVFPPQAARK